jgi:hypothetical protein
MGCDVSEHGIYRVTLERCPVENVPSSDDVMAFGGGFLIPKINGAQTFPSICPGTWRAGVLRVHDANEAPPPTDVALWHLTDPSVELLPLQACD